MSEITKADKIKCLKREIGFRKRVYKGRVDDGRMTQAESDREIAVMTAILHDYEPLPAMLL